MTGRSVVGVAFVSFVLLFSISGGEDRLSQPLPEGDVTILTDKLCYAPGEPVRVTASGFARLPAIGDFPVIFWAVTDHADRTVFETFNPADTIYDFNGTLMGTWNQTYRLANDTPPSGEHVPPGSYTIWFYMIPWNHLGWPFWPPMSIVIGDCSSNLRVLTKKDCYLPGEQVNISITNGGPSELTWGGPEPWFAVYDGAGNLVRTPFRTDLTLPFFLRPNETYSRLNWNQTYKVIDALGHVIPPSYEQVPEGAYTVLSWPSLPRGVAGTKSIRISSLCGSAGPIAEAGRDQTAFEGSRVSFDGSASHAGGGTGRWEPRANMTPPGCCGASAVLDDELYYAGGRFSDVTNWNKAWMFRKYTPANDSWTDLPALPGNRESPGAAAVNGKILVIGGWSGWLTVNTTLEFDHASNAWGERSPMPIAMAGFATAVVDGRVYTMGGHSSFMNCSVCSVVFEYDVANDTWSRKEDMPTPRASLAAAVLGGRIYAIGGYGPGALAAVEVYDPVTDEWEERSDMEEPRIGLSAVSLAGAIYALGGAPDWYPGNVTRTTETYDLVSDSWTFGPPMLEVRISFGSGVIGDCIYAVGGSGGPQPFLPNVSESLCLENELTYAWDFDASADSDGDGNYTDDVDATGPAPSWTYGDDGEFVVTLKVTDRMGRTGVDVASVTVMNLPPEITVDCAPGGGAASLYLRIAGEKWHDVSATLFRDGVESNRVSIVRRPGSPEDQTAYVGVVESDGGMYSARMEYTPEDDPINGQPNGATPAWIVLRQDNESDIRLHHTFNVRHAETWNWTVTHLEGYLAPKGVRCTATATDPGSDDLTFTWDWGDGTTATAVTFYNSGIGPDPFPSPGGHFPFTATDTRTHAYTVAGTYELKVTVRDDDRGQAEVAANLTVP